MKKEVIIGIVIFIVAVIGFLVIRSTVSENKNPNLEIVKIQVAQCSQEQYDTMVANAPIDGCETQWAVVCSEGSIWKYECFGGQIEDTSEEDLRVQLQAAQKEFYELCEQNPDIVCG